VISSKELLVRESYGRQWRAQQADRIQRIGVLMGYASTDPEGQALSAEFTQHLAELGSAEGRNVRIERWGGSNVDLLPFFFAAPARPRNKHI